VPRNQSPYAARTARRSQQPRNVLALIILAVFGIGVIAIGLFLLADQLGSATVGTDSADDTEEVAVSDDGEPGEEPTAEVEDDPTPLPVDADDMETAQEIAEGWVQLWEAEDYRGMYELISQESRSIIDRDDFVDRYEGIAEELAQTDIEVEITGAVEEALRFNLLVTRDSARAGEFEDEILLTMVQEAQGQPRVDWSPSLIVDELADGFIRWRPDIPQRGRILDQHGRPLAHLGQISKVGVTPGDVDDEDAMLSELSELLDMSEERIENTYSSGDPSWFMPIRDFPDNMDEELKDQLESIPGVSIQTWPERVYPAGAAAAHIVGYLTEVSSDELPELISEGYAPGDVLGRGGIESWGEEFLAGERGGRMLVVGPDGNERRTIVEVSSEPAADITLTIDIDLQRAAYDALGDEVGSVVVVDPENGAIRAMVSKPAFNPNDFILGHTSESWDRINDPDLRPLENRATTFAYPVGSIFKVITMAAGMEHLGMDAQTPMDCTAEFQLPGSDQVWRDWSETGQGTLSLHNALVQSCNTIFYQIGADLDSEDDDLLPEAARGFGLGSATGLDALREVSGTVPDPQWKIETVGDFWARGDAVNLAIGQGYFEATPLQMGVMYAAVANGGTLWEPYLVEQIASLEGDLLYEVDREEAGEIPYPESTLAEIRSAMRDVTQASNGTAVEVFDGALVPSGGKTGTAETGQDDPHSWYAAFAPDDGPEMALVAMVEYGGEGSAIAAPISRQVIDFWADNMR
jgi:penicillin-binding protein 2